MAMATRPESNEDIKKEKWENKTTKFESQNKAYTLLRYTRGADAAKRGR